MHGMFEPMVGRIPVMDVTPVVDRGRYPAKATVGEPFPVTRRRVPRGPRRARRRGRAHRPDGVRRPPVRMRQDAERAGPAGTPRSRPTPRAPGPSRSRRWCDPVATWQHDAEIKIPAGIDVELMFTEGALLLERARGDAARSAPTDRRTIDDAVTAVARHRPAPSRSRLAAAVSPERRRRCSPRHPLRDLVTIEGPYPFFADRQRALFGAWYEFFPRSEGAYVDQTTGKVVTGTFRTAAKRLDAVAAMGFDVIYLPPIHPIGEVNRKGPNNTLDPGARRPRLALGDRLARTAATTPSTPTSARSRTSTRSWRGPASSASRSPSTSRCRPRPTTRGSRTHPEWFTTRADGTIAYAENPPKKYQDIYPLNFDNDPDGHLRRGAAHRPALDVARRADLPRRQPAHQAGGVLGVAARRGPRAPTPTCSSWPRRSPGRR